MGRVKSNEVRDGAWETCVVPHCSCKMLLVLAHIHVQHRTQKTIVHNIHITLSDRANVQLICMMCIH